MKMNYCYLCGQRADAITTHDGTHWKCQGCGQTFYDNPKPATEAILVTEDFRVVVAVRARDPHKGKLDLPGGLVDCGETIEHALVRELEEELGLLPKDYSGPIYLPSAVDDYPWGPEHHSVITVPFTARIDAAAHLEPQDDVAEVALRSIDELNIEDFAWPTQYNLVVAALEYWKAQARG